MDDLRIVTAHIEPVRRRAVKAEPDRQGRYHYVDLLRGLAALVVLVAHYQWFFAVDLGDLADPKITQPPGHGWLWPIYIHSGLAVQFFFVLSGFVFAVAYGHFGRGVSTRDFMVHRFARLYPLHFATLVFIAGMQAIGLAINGVWQVYGNNDVPHFFLHMAFASNWFTLQSSFNGPIWSVSIEVLIYLVFLGYMKFTGLRLLPALFLAGVFFFVGRLTQNPVAICGALFFAGVLVGIVSPYVQQLLRGRSIMLGLGVCLALLAGMWGLRLVGYGGREELIIAYLLMPALIFTFAALDRNVRPLAARLRWIGAITYAVYLLHMPVVITARTLAPDLFADYSWLRQWLVFLAYIGTVILLALAVHYWFELPAQRFFRRRFASSPPPGLPACAGAKTT